MTVLGSSHIGVSLVNVIVSIIYLALFGRDPILITFLSIFTLYLALTSIYEMLKFEGKKLQNESLSYLIYLFTFILIGTTLSLYLIFHHLLNGSNQDFLRNGPVTLLIFIILIYLSLGLVYLYKVFTLNPDRTLPDEGILEDVSEVRAEG